MHVPRFSADEGFVGFDFGTGTANLLRQTQTAKQDAADAA